MIESGLPAIADGDWIIRAHLLCDEAVPDAVPFASAWARNGFVLILLVLGHAGSRIAVK